MLIVGATMLYINVALLRQERLLHTEEMTATAIVLTKSSQIIYDQQSRSQSIEYDLGYRFTTQDGAPVSGSDEVNLRTWKSIRERDPIQIVYLPEHQATSRLVANDPGTSPRSTIVLGEALVAGGTLILSYGLFDVAQTRRRARK